MDVAELARQIEYKVAPAPLIAVQGLANTFAFETDEERLLDPGTTRRWLLESDLLGPRARVGEDERAKLVAFRSAARELIEANLTGELDRASAATLRRFVAEHPVQLAATGAGGVSLDLDPPGTVDGLIAQMVGIIYKAQLEDEWGRLKVCASDECRWAFYDSSRNRGGTWCQMETCGNRIKNRAYRRRKAGTPDKGMSARR